MTDKRIVIFGSPGSGKGTQAVMIAKELDLKKISLGDILREEVKKGSELGEKVKSYMEKGLLVPDDLVSQVIEENIAQTGFILDGYPRNLDQAKNLEAILKKKNLEIDIFLYLQVNQETIIERLTKRGRGDDDPEVIAKRWEVFINECNQILEFYRNNGKLMEVNGQGSIEDIFKRIKDLLE